MFIKKIMLSFLAVTALSIPSVTAYAYDSTDCIKVVKEAPADKEKDKEKHKQKGLDSMTSEQLKKLAEKFKIDTTGLDDEQIKEKIKECKPKYNRFDKMTSAELKALAEKLEIDTTDMNDEQIKEKIKQVIKEKKANSN